MDKAFELISNYGYLIVFLGTMLDQSGIPIFIIVGAVIAQAGNLNHFLVFVLAYSALISTDILFIYLGSYLRNITKLNTQNSKVIGVLKKVLIRIVGLFLNNRIVFYIFSKFVPLIGKYIPVLVGYSDESKRESILYFALGNILYCVTFYFSALFLFNMFVEYSKIISICLLIIFLVIYFSTSKKAKDRIRNSLDK